MGELTDSEKAVLAREIAADDYDRQWPMTTSYGNHVREGFVSGWDAAMDYVAAQFDDDDDPELSAALRKLTPEQLDKILREELGR